ncbi:Protein-L-isoaspartate O-methyltransferase [Moritella sp. JT01]|uniref:protein-L-isoaspartate O-methyltransferase family protein n=1 Tax=Moritella sp. JT01 TaxID=756698 RepID=UPI0007944E01|nr:protein-L-isoaspartate O-methyltransferase [Moritella sp. JT01]KXO10872.1 Protein-L-isoaspartate O-methyltransferase [Moritella sp. JT01]
MNKTTIDKRVEQAFRTVKRRYFMPTDNQHMADYDAPFSIGHAQTISQPTTVKHMLLWLAPETGQRILDVGSGSGWSTALLADLVGPTGSVFAVERIPVLKRFGETNCQRFGGNNIEFFITENRLGLATHAPFDRILVSAAATDEIPDELIDQLAPNGKLIIPVNNSIFELQKDAQGEIEYCHEHLGYVFVPLITATDNDNDNDSTVS